MSLSHAIRRQGDVVAGACWRAGSTGMPPATLDEAYAAAVDRRPRVVELDFTGVDYINSTGIALIVGLLGTARAQRPRGAGRRASPSTTGTSSRSPGCRDFIEIVQPAPTARSCDMSRRPVPAPWTVTADPAPGAAVIDIAGDVTAACEEALMAAHEEASDAGRPPRHPGLLAAWST